MSGALIRVENLVFDYPSQRALNGVSFEVLPQSITGLVGPNGAGKTTLLRCIASLETPVAGRIEVDGLNVQEEPREIHRRMGYLPDLFGLYDDLTVERCLGHRAGMQLVAPGQSRGLIEKAAARTGLSDRLGQKAGELSRGLRQRLAIAQSILHEPRIVLLDEPASGLDPEARQDLAELIRELSRQGMTLIVSSHILAELADYCSHMMILRDGQLVEHRRIAPSGEDGQRLSVTIELAEPDTRLEQLLAAWTDCELLSATETGARLLMAGAPAARHRLLKHLMENGLAVAGFEVQRADLQEAYLAQLRNGQSA